MKSVGYRFTWPIKTRLLATATILIFVAAMATTSFAMMPLMSGEGHVCPMKQPGTMQHNCKHEAPRPMPCCPMQTPTTNPVPTHSPSPAECMTRGECCQMSQERTRPIRQDGRMERASNFKAKSGEDTGLLHSSSSKHAREWLNAGLRYERPVFDLKTDLRI